MQAITFKQFIKTFNFREINQQADSEYNKYNTKVVRIYIDNDNFDNWFEFGLYDYNSATWNLAKKVLSNEICKSYISSIAYDINLEIFQVYLQTTPKLL